MSDHTMRDLWEDVRNRHSSIEAMGKDGPYLFCECCDENWPCIDHWNATAALRMLDEARAVGGEAAAYPGAPKPRKRHRLIPDPEVRS